MKTDAPVLEELGFYTLAGQPSSSRELIAEVAASRSRPRAEA